MEKQQYGLTDLYAVNDGFGISEYIDGLSEFIIQCTTPMTVSVQGDWGTGKTSIMQMVKMNLEKSNVDTQWFNTWQYSQFDLGDKLGASLLLSLSEGLAESDDTNKVKKTIGSITSNIGRITKALIKGQSDKYLGEEFTNELKRLGLSDGDVDIEDPTRAIVDLKNQFQKAINESLKKRNKEKLVVFIDDLDRLRPERAVEILEIMKLFLDCESCVFILAIDYAVVVRGVKSKYGEDFDERKGKAFFDKIIQVPFSVPVSDYDIAPFVKKCLYEIGETNIPEEYIYKYEELIHASVGSNPRSIKRIFNAFMLILKVSRDSVSQDEDQKLLLFAVLCMQNRFDKAYNAIMLERNSLNPYEFAKLTKGDDALLKSFGLSSDETDEFVSFVSVLSGLLDSVDDHPTDGNVSRIAIDNLIDILDYSATTSNAEIGKSMGAISHEQFLSRFNAAQKLLNQLGDNYLGFTVAYTKQGVRFIYKEKTVISLYLNNTGSKVQSCHFHVDNKLFSNEKARIHAIHEMNQYLGSKRVKAGKKTLKIDGPVTIETIDKLLKYIKANYSKLY